MEDLVKFGHLVCEIHERTDRQTNTLIAVNGTQSRQHSGCGSVTWFSCDW